MKRLSSGLLFVSITFSLFLFAYSVSAQSSGGSVLQDISAQTGAAGQGTGLAAGKRENALPFYISQIISASLGLLGVVALVLILAGGFKWMTAGGNEENVEKAKQLLGNATIGLAIILISYAATRFIFKILLAA